MAQPMTLIATPDPDSTPATAACPEGVPFCNGACAECGDGYHASDITFLKAKRWHSGPVREDEFGEIEILPGKFRKTELSLAVCRQDSKKKPGKPRISLITDNLGDEIRLTATRARMLAAALLNAADQADPVPAGALVVQASDVRIGDEVLTPDGWQNVVGQMAFTDQANVWTDTYERDPETDGWRYEPADPVKVRRPLNGGDAVLESSEISALCAVGWCSRCRADRVISGSQTVSARGVIRVRGRCQTCDKRSQCAFVGLTSWAEDNR